MGELYFKDNFFNAGLTEIMDAEGNRMGEIDLHGMFGSKLTVYGRDGRLECEGRFRFFRWHVEDGAGRPLGELRNRMSLMTKRYEYDAGKNGVYEIISPAFSREYTITDKSGAVAAKFNKVSGWLQSGAFHLINRSGHLGDYELVAVVMGVHELRKRDNNSAAT